MPDGTFVTKNLIEDVLEHQRGDLSISHHISEAHLNVTRRARQNIRMAAQQFSCRTAQAVKYVLHKDREGNIIELINNVFDILYSRFPKDEKAPLRSGYGLNHRSHENTLKRFLEICSVMRLGKRQSSSIPERIFNLNKFSHWTLYRCKKHRNKLHSDF